MGRDYTTSFYGRFRELSFSDLIHSLAVQKETGALYLRHDKVLKRLFLDQGRIVYVQSSLVQENLFRKLVEMGRIAIPLPGDLVAQAKTPGFSLTAWAVRNGFLRPDEVAPLLGELAERRVLEVFRWRDGDYLFIFDEPVPEAFRGLGVALDPTTLISKGLRQYSSWEELRAFAKHNGFAMPRLTQDIDVIKAHLQASGEEQRLLRRIDGSTYFLDIVYAAPMETDAALVFMRRLLIEGFMEFPHDTIASNRTLAELNEREREFADLLSRDAERMLEKSPFELFQIGRYFTDEDVRRGYYQLAQKYHQTELVPNLPAQHQVLAKRLFDRASSHFEALITWYKARQAGRFDYFFHLANETVDDIGSTIEAEGHALAARAAAERGDLDTADRELRLAEKLVDYCAEYRRLRGAAPLDWALRNGRAIDPQWMTYLTQALHLDAYDARIYHDLARCQEHTGDRDRANEFYKRAYELDSTHRDALSGLIRTRPRMVDQTSHAGENDEERLASVMTFVEAKEDKDLYAVLGVAQDAPESEIKRAYFQLAKELHPDSLGRLKDHPLAQRAFMMINEAYEILSSKDKRRMYDRGIRASESQKKHLDQARKVRAQQLFSRAQSLITQGHFDDAVETLTEVAELSPDMGAALAYRVWAEFLRDHKSKSSSRHTAETRLQDLMSQFPDIDEPYYVMAKIALVYDDLGRAKSNLTRGLEINPDSVEINREMRLLNQRLQTRKTQPKPTTPSPADDKKGILGGFFKKK